MPISLGIGLGLTRWPKGGGDPNAAQDAAVNAAAFAVYDALDQSSMFEDIAGTTAITTHNQQVGLWLDKKHMQGKTAAQFITDQPDTKSAGAVGLVGSATAAAYNTGTGVGSASRAADVSNQSYVTWTGLVSGQTYRIDITNTGSVSIIVRAGGIAGSGVQAIGTATTLAIFVTAVGGAVTVGANANASTATFTVNSFKAVPGYHLGQATGTKRPRWQSDTAYWSLKGDGVDDCLQSITTMDLSGTDKVTVVAPVRKLSDAAAAMVVELTSGLNGGNTGFYITAPEATGLAGNFGFKSRGSVNVSAAQSSVILAPISSVITGVGDVAADIQTIYSNGVQVGFSGVDQGTGNYSNAPLNVFSRNNGAAHPFSGHISGLIIANNINQTDRETLYWPWANRRMIPN